ncbi:MAG: cyclic nucleotide-binding domain-containing protein [Anaerolineae bacterium]|jgi:CRP-like cAMP-binding protein
MTATELLQRSELLAGMTSEQIQKIAALGKEVEYSAGAVVVREGEVGDELYILREGMVEVLVSKGAIADVPGPPRMEPVVRLGPGQSFGEMSLVDRGTRSATVRCVEDGTNVYVVPRDGLLDLCDSDPRIGYVLMHNIASDLSFKLRHRNLRLRLEGEGGVP